MPGAQFAAQWPAFGADRDAAIAGALAAEAALHDARHAALSIVRGALQVLYAHMQFHLRAAAVELFAVPQPQSQQQPVMTTQREQRRALYRHAWRTRVAPSLQLQPSAHVGAGVGALVLAAPAPDAVDARHQAADAAALPFVAAIRAKFDQLLGE